MSLKDQASGFWEGFEKQAFACKEAGIFGAIGQKANSALTKVRNFRLPAVTAAGKAERVAADAAHAKSLRMAAYRTPEATAARKTQQASWDARNAKAEAEAKDAYGAKHRAMEASSDAKFKAMRDYREPYEIPHYRNPMDHG